MTAPSSRPRSTLADLLAEHSEFTDAAAAHLQRLVADDWQLLADLSFADCLLAVADRHGRFRYVAQCRPNTAATVRPEDEVGRRLGGADDLLVRRAWYDAEIRHDGVDPAGPGLRREAIPVGYGGGVVAVMLRVIDPQRISAPSTLEAVYRECADDLCRMVADGTFPTPEGNPRGLSTPRAGDGFIRIDGAGLVTYASPNALSAYHRMGVHAELLGEPLAGLTAEVVTDPFEAAELTEMLDAAADWVMRPGGPAMDVGTRMEVDAHRATVLMRVVPLYPAGRSTGAVILVRDVTELKRRDLALISKDATIREIHHRVKNNLQSVSALLRLQARRATTAEARTALTEAVRRVASIALIHELLSGSVDEEVDFDEVVDRLVPILLDVAADDRARPPRIERRSRFGILPADSAMPLAMVLTEVVQNAIEHGFTAEDAQPRIELSAVRDLRRLKVQIRDNGAGLPADFDPEAGDRLGMQIVRTLVGIELGGELSMSTGPAGRGTEVTIDVPLA